MPYSPSLPPKSLTKKLKKKYPNITKKQIRQFIHVLNSAMKDGDSEERAFSKAWGTLKKIKKKKSEIMTDLVKLANYLDQNGLNEEADLLDSYLKNK